jgi:hypothetical protein
LTFLDFALLRPYVLNRQDHEHRTTLQMSTAPQQRRCLIVERHDWETGAFSHQLQFPLDAAREFFGPDGNDIDVHIRLFNPPDEDAPTLEADLTVSRRYQASGTRRTNRVPELGEIPASFIFFEETDTPGTYDVWWNTDKAVVAARLHPWRQARSSQYRRGRLFMILDAPVPRVITRID